MSRLVRSLIISLVEMILDMENLKEKLGNYYLISFHERRKIYEILEIKNKFFGEDINVAGLIVGQDIIDTIKNRNIEHLILPSVMLQKNGENYKEIFLDGKTLDDIKNLNKNMQIHILKDYYSFEEILQIINNL